MIRKALSALARLGRAMRREDGTASVEFVLVFPVIVSIMFQAFETGWLTVRQTMLERALDMTVRELRLGHFINPTQDSLRNYVCSLTVVISDCTNTLMIELDKVDTTAWTMPSPSATCVSRGAKVQPVVNVTQGGGDDLMIIRACAVVDVMFPLTGVGMDLPKDSSGGVSLVASSAFVNEPS